MSDGTQEALMAGIESGDEEMDHGEGETEKKREEACRSRNRPFFGAHGLGLHVYVPTTQNTEEPLKREEKLIQNASENRGPYQATPISTRPHNGVRAHGGPRVSVIERRKLEIMT